MIKINKAVLRVSGEYSNPPEAEDYFLKCKKENERLFDGSIFILKDMETRKNTVEMNLYKGRYSAFLYNEISKEKVQPIGVDVLLETEDDYFLLCKMAAWTYTAGKIKTIGGNMDEQDKGEILNPKRTAVREIKEELGIDYPIGNLKLEYLYSNPSGFVSLCYRGNLSGSRHSAEESFLKWKEKDEEEELESLFFLKKDNKEIKEFLESGIETTKCLREWLFEILKDC